MNVLDKELQNRKDEIIKGLKLFVKANVNITSWDVPEVDEKEAEQKLIALMQEALTDLKNEYKN